MAKNVTIENLLAWDNFQGKDASVALPAIYLHAKSASDKLRNWYWNAIANKKRAAVLSLQLTVLFLIVGTILPVVAGLWPNPEQRLYCTQSGVIALAVAGLMQVCDRTFGLTSGWMRYIATVTAIESLTREFELGWAEYIIAKGAALADADIKPMFDLAKQLEIDIGKMQSEETAKWASDFGSSLAALNELIKSQRESAAKDVAERAELAEKAKARLTGSLEVSIDHAGEPVPVEITVDESEPAEYLGRAWAATNLSAGQHKVTLKPKAGGATPIQKIAAVPVGGVASLAFKLG